MFDEMDGSGMSTQDPNPARDVIAENIYGLIGEVFDMRGVFKWVRKSLMTFVQITYGSTINRKGSISKGSGQSFFFLFNLTWLFFATRHTAS